jgi:hypothetical protein
VSTTATPRPARGAAAPRRRHRRPVREPQAKDYSFARPGIRDEDWGRILEVADPFGNRPRFWQRNA